MQATNPVGHLKATAKRMREAGHVRAASIVLALVSSIEDEEISKIVIDDPVDLKMALCVAGIRIAHGEDGTHTLFHEQEGGCVRVVVKKVKGRFGEDVVGAAASWFLGFGSKLPNSGDRNDMATDIVDVKGVDSSKDLLIVTLENGQRLAVLNDDELGLTGLRYPCEVVDVLVRVVSKLMWRRESTEAVISKPAKRLIDDVVESRCLFSVMHEVRLIWGDTL